VRPIGVPSTQPDAARALDDVFPLAIYCSAFSPSINLTGLEVLSNQYEFVSLRLTIKHISEIPGRPENNGTLVPGNVLRIAIASLTPFIRRVKDICI
jgi:hypothetical protein